MSIASPSTLTADDIIGVFNSCFFETEHTLLVGGAQEPFYTPWRNGQPAEIQFRADFVRSALHEVAHWCLAGKMRRSYPDYGYWYSPDDRNVHQQQAFFAVEARPQSLERLFCAAIALPFSPSIDNLSLQISAEDIEKFTLRLHMAEQKFLAGAMPGRAQRFIAALEAIKTAELGLLSQGPTTSARSLKNWGRAITLEGSF